MLQRAAIVLLVVLNLGAAAWWWLHAPPPVEAPAGTPAGAARLHLVAELPQAAQPAAGVAASAKAPPPAALQLESGPMPAQAQAMPAASATACESGDGSTSSWRVYLPRLPSTDAARATAARIGEAGFSDYLVVVEGADANSIALGRYGTAQAAQRRTAALRASGFPARCARIPPATPA